MAIFCWWPLVAQSFLLGPVGTCQNNSSIAACIFSAAGTWLPNRFLATVVGIHILREQGDLINQFLFCQNKESRWTVYIKIKNLHMYPWICRGEWRYSSNNRDLGNRCRCVVSFTLRPLYERGKSPQHSLDCRLSGPQNRCECCGEKKNCFPLTRIEPRPSGLYAIATFIEFVV
jgi:hypothetical protein